jgi:hypothetical protein
MEGGENAARQKGCCEVDDAGGSRLTEWTLGGLRQGVRASGRQNNWSVDQHSDNRGYHGVDSRDGEVVAGGCLF